METKETGKLKKKILIGIAIALAVVALASYEIYMRLKRGPVGDGKYTATIEPQEITMKVNTSRNVTVIFISTGFEGYVVITLSNLSPSPHDYDVSFFVDEPEWQEEGYFLPEFGTVEITATIGFRDFSGRHLDRSFNVGLWLSTCGNYQEEDEIWVPSKPVVEITVTP